MTDETKRDLKLLRLRGTFDPKRFYKSSDHKKGLPKFFQVGTVVESSADFYSGVVLASKDAPAYFARPICNQTFVRLPLVTQTPSGLLTECAFPTWLHSCDVASWRVMFAFLFGSRFCMSSLHMITETAACCVM